MAFTNLKKWSIPLFVTLVGISMILHSQPVQADPHAGQSQNVVIIGGSALDTGVPCVSSGPAANVMGATFGGCLPVTGPAGELGDFTFAPMDPAAVDAASLAPFDTAVLNVASSAMGCATSSLTPSQQADLVAFVGAGKKLIIYDSECFPGPVDYSWLPYPFSTSNPGALGAPGTLTIVEDNLLSTLIADPTCLGGDTHCIDVAFLGVGTDAVGDMNVMTTFDPNWCVDMSGTNAIGTTGPVHTYANYPSGTDDGLIIYNGLDVDYQVLNEPNLRKIWVQELQQPFSPSGLLCRITVVGITLAPETDQNLVGEDHTVTATLSDLLGNPQVGIEVTFTVIVGPNAGASGVSTTDANGEASFTYTGIAGIGVDQIEACFTNLAGDEVCSQIVTKEWLNQPPDCSTAEPSIDTLWPPNHKFVAVNILGVTDPDGDPVTISIYSIYQDEPVDTIGDGSFAPDGQGVGTDTAEVRAERTGTKEVPGNGRVYTIRFTATDDKGASCSGTVLVGVPHDQGQGAVPVNDGDLYDSTVTP